MGITDINLYRNNEIIVINGVGGNSNYHTIIDQSKDCVQIKNKIIGFMESEPNNHVILRSHISEESNSNIYGIPEHNLNILAWQLRGNGLEVHVALK